MDNEEKHYPGQEEPTPHEEPQAEEPQTEEPKEEPQAEEPKEEEKTEEPSEPINKKRSIYEDYKEKKAEAKEAKAEAEAAKARIAELEALVQNQADAKTPKEQAKADDDVSEFLNKLQEDGGLTPEGVEQLAKVLEKRVAKPSVPDDLQSELAEFRKFREEQARKAEDDAIRATAPSIQKELGIHDTNELATVMNEIVKLAHTPEFHDKEVDYILWKNRDTLSKLVSPKKPSFESGDTRPESEGTTEVDFSKGGITPEMAQRAHHRQTRQEYDIERSK